MKSINIQAFYEDFKKEWLFLTACGSGCENIAGFSEAVRWYDRFYETDNGKAMIHGFIKYRDNTITTDREKAAFAFAFENLS